MARAITIGSLVGIILLILAYAFFVFHSPKPSLASDSVAEAPWPAETTYLKARLGALGLPALSEEGTALHTHQHLDILVHGQAVAVPPGIGIHESFPSYIAPIHVHDTSGIIHVESPVVETFTLGQFFDIWGVRLTSACIGGYCADDKNSLEFYVNGERYQGDPRQIPLAEHEEIAVIYGSAAERTASIPSTYTFPLGL